MSAVSSPQFRREAECAGFLCYSLGDASSGRRLYVHATDRFKTTTLRLYLHTPLLAGEAALTALLPAVLRHGCERIPSRRSLSHYLDELYGAEFESDVLKIGERHLVTLALDVVSERFLAPGKQLLEKGIGLLGEMLLHPLSPFPADLVEQEKSNLVHMVDSLVDDKLHYAIERCFQSMCGGEPFAVYEYGTAATIAEITPESLRDHLDLLLATAPMDLFAVGAVDPDELAALAARTFASPRGELRVPPPTRILPAPSRPRRLQETIPGGSGGHGELVLGYRTALSMHDSLAPALIVLDDLLGGGPSSRLFRILREEQQLMYSISSFLVKTKGLWVVVASVAPEARHLVEKAVELELSRVAHSEVSDEDFQASRQQVLSQIRSINDGPGKQISFLLGRLINERISTPAEVERELAEVTLAELAAAAATLKLDTSYYLMSESTT